MTDPSDLIAGLLRIEKADPKNVDAENSLETLQKLMFNVISEPSDAKFRRIRKSNATISRAITLVQPAAALLRAFGFVDEDEFFVLPFDKEVDEVVAALVTEAHATVHDTKKQNEQEERQKQLLASAKKRDQEKVERDRLAALAKQDQAERRERDSMRVIKASSPATLGAATGNAMKGFKDIGVDLNKKQGG